MENNQPKEKPYDHYNKTQAPLREDKESQPQKCLSCNRPWSEHTHIFGAVQGRIECPQQSGWEEEFEKLWRDFEEENAYGYPGQKQKLIAFIRQVEQAAYERGRKDVRICSCKNVSGDNPNCTIHKNL